MGTGTFGPVGKIYMYVYIYIYIFVIRYNNKGNISYEKFRGKNVIRHTKRELA